MVPGCLRCVGFLHLRLAGNGLMRTQDSHLFIMAELSNLVALRVRDLGEEGIRKNLIQCENRVLLKMPLKLVQDVVRVDVKLVHSFVR
jgi:hypothetical protein